MTTTISRLYDTYADAERAVTRLEGAGAPHSDISIVANNSDNWFGSRSTLPEREPYQLSELLATMLMSECGTPARSSRVTARSASAYVS